MRMRMRTEHSNRPVRFLRMCAELPPELKEMGESILQEMKEEEEEQARQVTPPAPTLL